MSAFLAATIDGYIQSHVRRLEALRRAGIVERLDGDHWSIPADYEARAAAYDADTEPANEPSRAIRPMISIGRSPATAPPGSTANWSHPIGRR